MAFRLYLTSQQMTTSSKWTVIVIMDIPETQENNLSDGFADTASSESGVQDVVGHLSYLLSENVCNSVVLANVHRFRVITFRFSHVASFLYKFASP